MPDRPHAAPDTSPVSAATGPPSADGDLIRRLRAGDEAAFAELVRDYAGRLLAVTRRILRNDADAEDALQETFVSAFKSIHAFDGRAALGTWLHRIAVNAALMRARRTTARRESSIEPLLPQFAGGLHSEPPPTWRDVTGDALVESETQAALYAALDRLPEEFRAVIVLKDIEGLESRAIAEALGVSDALVRQRLHRGRQALLKLMTPYMAEERR